MSYINDKKAMAQEAENHRGTVLFVIKVTFIAFAVSLALLVLALAINGIFGKDGDTELGVGGKGEPPFISGPADGYAFAYIGENILYKSYIQVSDDTNSSACRITVDSSAVNPDVEGNYPVIYTVTDEDGNQSEYELTLVIKKQEYSYDSLMELIAKKAEDLGITSSMSKEEQIKIIFNYVNSPTKGKYEATVEFTNQSNSKRSDWKADWIEEAYLTLKSGSGDCYSYYSLSKAFFEYLGIENYGIKRDDNVEGQSGTHFWSLVNIGNAWYHYDATRLLDKFIVGSGCLFTEDQLNDYNTNVKPGFYTYTHTGYPKASNKVINEDYSWSD